MVVYRSKAQCGMASNGNPFLFEGDNRFDRPLTEGEQAAIDALIECGIVEDVTAQYASAALTKKPMRRRKAAA